MQEPYDHKKNLSEARRREERRELVIATVALAVKAAICGAIAWRARTTPASGLLWALAMVFFLGAVHCGAQAVWFDREGER